MTCKGGQHGTHVQGALTLHDALLQGRLVIEPLFGQGAAPAVDVGHAMPGHVGRAGEVGAHLLVAHAQPGPHVVPHRFLSRDGQRQIHAVQSHPVDEAFPVAPLPEGHRVAPSAVVEEETLRHAGRDLLGCGHVGQGLGQFNSHVGIPRHGRVAVAVQVAVQAHRHRPRVVAADDDITALALEREHVLAAVGLNFLELHLLGQRSRQAGSQGLGLLHIGVGYRTGGQRDHQRYPYRELSCHSPVGVDCRSHLVGNANLRIIIYSRCQMAVFY